MTSANWAIGSPYTPTGDYSSVGNWTTFSVPDETAVFGQSNVRIVSIATASVDQGSAPQTSS